MAKLTLPFLLQRLQLMALQLMPQNQQQPQHQPNTNQQKAEPEHAQKQHGCQLMVMQLGKVMLLYGCLLLLHASVSVSVSATASATDLGTVVMPAIVNLSSAKNLGQEQGQKLRENLVEKRAWKREAANVPEDDYDASYPDEVDDLEALLNNKSGEFLGFKVSSKQVSKSIIKGNMAYELYLVDLFFATCPSGRGFYFIFYRK